MKADHQFSLYSTLVAKIPNPVYHAASSTNMGVCLALHLGLHEGQGFHTVHVVL